MSNTPNTDWQRLQEMPDADIDTSDIPELDDEFFQKAQLTTTTKQPITPKP